MKRPFSEHPLWEQIRSKRSRRLGREFTWITLGQLATIVGSLVGIRILTEILSPAQYGELALGMTAATLAQTVVLTPLSNGATRFYAPAKEAGSLRAYLAAVFQMTVASTGGILAASALVGVTTVAVGAGRWMGLLLAALIFALLSGYNSILNGMQNAARQRAIVALHQGAATWGRFLLAAGLMLWLGASSTVAMWGYCLAMVFVLVSQTLFFRRVVAPTEPDVDGGKPASHWRNEMFAYSWPFATWGILSWARQVADRWGLEIFATTTDVGLYAVLYQLGYYPTLMLIGMMTTLLSPIYFQRIGDASSGERVEEIFRTGWKVMWIATAGMTVAAGGVYLLHEQIFALFVASEYAHISYLLAPMMMAAVLYEVTRFLTIVIHAQNATKVLILPANASHLLGFALILLGAYWNGLVGVVVAYVIQAAIIFVWFILLFLSQRRKIPTSP